MFELNKLNDWNNRPEPDWSIDHINCITYKENWKLYIYIIGQRLRNGPNVVPILNAAVLYTGAVGPVGSI
jgi:hypothetical protein